MHLRLTNRHLSTPHWLFFLLAMAGVSTFIEQQLAAEPQPPRTVPALFADFDPRKDPVDVKVVREWNKEGVVYRYVTYHIATFKGTPARMAAFYGFPEAAKNRPALLHLHGGGQRAFLHEVEFFAKQGYPVLSINWGGREMEEAQPGDPNTDWGAVDPTQQNVPGYSNLKPGEKYLDPYESPKNNNWYLLTLGARRGLTFLEQQSEVDPKKLGVYGHSMGGNLTIYVAGSDQRVQAAAPSVGGTGFRTRPWELLPQARKQTPQGDLELFRSTLEFERYAECITAPVLWLSSTNDFHGIMDDMFRTGAMIPHDHVRYSVTPHMNHRFTPEFTVTRSLWLNEHLRQGPKMPETPQVKLTLSSGDHPQLKVTAANREQLTKVEVFYSLDPDPRARFWRSAEVVPQADHWMAELPILTEKEPLFAFANAFYQLAEPEAVPFARPTKQFALSSRMVVATPEELTKATVRAQESRDKVIDDFRHGWRDWYQLSPENPDHWEFSTRKVADRQWRGKEGEQLLLEVTTESENELVVVLTQNFFREYRGKSEEYIAVIKLTGGAEKQRILLAPSDFKTPTAARLGSWKELDLLSLRAYYEKGDYLVGSKKWMGKQPRFITVGWE